MNRLAGQSMVYLNEKQEGKTMADKKILSEDELNNITGGVNMTMELNGGLVVGQDLLDHLPEGESIMADLTSKATGRKKNGKNRSTGRKNSTGARAL